jgi:hypothetical protein
MEKQFAEGISFRFPRENAPAWVKGSIFIRVRDAINFLEKHDSESGFITIDVKESKGGKLYCELNSWQPGQGINKASDEDVADSIPF